VNLPMKSSSKPTGLNIARESDRGLPEDSPKIGAVVVVALTIILLLASLLLWSSSLLAIDVTALTELGLVSVIPVEFILSLLCLIAGFCLALRKDTPEFLYFIQVVALIIILDGTLAILYDLPRYYWTYNKIGTAAYIQANGGVDLFRHAYFNWAGYHAFAAFFNAASGLPSAIIYASWAPFFFDLLYVGGLLFSFRVLTNDRRLVWLGIWFFTITNWVGQNYFSPQGLSYFFYLMMIGICLRWFAAEQDSLSEIHVNNNSLFGILRAVVISLVKPVFQRAKESDTAAPLGPKAVFILLFAATVISHQLTPLIVIVSVILLIVFKLVRERTLPILMLVMVAAWVIYMADAFITSRTEIFDYILRLQGNIVENVSVRYQLVFGEPHTSVVLASYALTISVWVLALFGLLRRSKDQVSDRAVLLLAGAPFLMILLFSYGGEIFQRIYLFSLPWMAFFAAGYALPSRGGAKRKLRVPVEVISCGLLSLFLLAYYGNEKMNHMSRADFNAVQYINDNAAPRAAVFIVSNNFPREFDKFTEFGYGVLAPQFIADVDDTSLDVIVDLMSYEDYVEAYLLLTESQEANVELYSILPEGDYARLVDMVLSSDRFEVVYQDAGSYVLVLSEAAKEDVQ